MGQSTGHKVYVGNLPFSATDESLHEAFAAYGQVNSARIIMDRDSGRSKGFGFVEMSTQEEAQNSIDQLNGQQWEGRALTVNIARPMAPRDSSSSRGRSW